MTLNRSDYHSAATGGLQALPPRLDRTLLTERKIHGRQHRGETTAHVAHRLAKAYPQCLRRHAATQKSPASDKHRRAVRDQLAAELSATRSTPAPSLLREVGSRPEWPAEPVGIDAGHFLHLVPYSRNYGGVAALPTLAGCWHFPQCGQSEPAGRPRDTGARMEASSITIPSNRYIQSNPMSCNRLHVYCQSIQRVLAETQCLLETEPVDELQVLRCRDLLEKATVLAAEASTSSHHDEQVHRLTPREQEVAAALSTGQSNYEIAADLFISVNTVRFHIRNILRKLDAKNRSEVAAIVSRRKTHVPPDGRAVTKDPTYRHAPCGADLCVETITFRGEEPQRGSTCQPAKRRCTRGA